MINIHNYKEHDLTITVEWNDKTNLNDKISIFTSNGYMLKLVPYSHTYWIYFYNNYQDETAYYYYQESTTLDFTELKYLALDYNFVSKIRRIDKSDERFIWANSLLHLLKQIYILSVGV